MLLFYSKLCFMCSVLKDKMLLLLIENLERIANDKWKGYPEYKAERHNIQHRTEEKLQNVKSAIKAPLKCIWTSNTLGNQCK